MIFRGLVIIALVIGIWGFFKNPKVLVKEKSPSVSKAIDSPSNYDKVPKSKALSPIEVKLRQEASHVSRMDAAPDDTEFRLQDWAHTLSAAELEQLEKAALDIQKPQDDRFLAVMLLAWSEKTEALENLKDIALSEIDPFLSPNRLGDFERVLRMQAVDGMLDIPVQGENIAKTLQSVAASTADTTIADRAYRALASVQDEVKTPKEQDEEALKRIKAKTLIIGIDNDLLFPIAEQRFLAANIFQARLAEVNSFYGHDGFLIETEALTKEIGKFIKSSDVESPIINMHKLA